MMSPEERFWSFTERCGECRLWKGGTNPIDGAPRFHLTVDEKQYRSVSGHRWIYELKVGPIPYRAAIRATCGNILCVSLQHLKACERSKRRPGADVTGRFMAHVMPVTESGCWLWTGAWLIQGRGKFQIGKKGYLASRAAWMLFKGDIPEGLDVCHRCDVGPCVNPDHLFLGTHAENMDDRNVKGRQARGETSGRSKLTEASVRAIRADSRNHVEVGRHYGIHPSVVLRVRRGEAWKHVGDFFADQETSK